jgi:hypothetical protein
MLTNLNSDVLELSTCQYQFRIHQESTPNWPVEVHSFTYGRTVRSPRRAMRSKMMERKFYSSPYRQKIPACAP